MLQQPKKRVFPDDGDTVLHIGGIFPIAGEGGWQGGQACMPAANLALEDVNKRPDLLPGFTLKLHSNDSEVSTSSTSYYSNGFERESTSLRKMKMSWLR